MEMIFDDLIFYNNEVVWCKVFLYDKFFFLGLLYGKYDYILLMNLMLIFF